MNKVPTYVTRTARWTLVLSALLHAYILYAYISVKSAYLTGYLALVVGVAVLLVIQLALGVTYGLARERRKPSGRRVWTLLLLPLIMAVSLVGAVALWEAVFNPPREPPYEAIIDDSELRR